MGQNRRSIEFTSRPLFTFETLNGIICCDHAFITTTRQTNTEVGGHSLTHRVAHSIRAPVMPVKHATIPLECPAETGGEDCFGQNYDHRQGHASVEVLKCLPTHPICQCFPSIVTNDDACLVDTLRNRLFNIPSLSLSAKNSQFFFSFFFLYS